MDTQDRNAGQVSQPPWNTRCEPCPIAAGLGPGLGLSHLCLAGNPTSTNWAVSHVFHEETSNREEGVWRHSIQRSFPFLNLQLHPTKLEWAWHQLKCGPMETKVYRRPFCEEKWKCGRAAAPAFPVNVGMGTVGSAIWDLCCRQKGNKTARVGPGPDSQQAWILCWEVHTLCCRQEEVLKKTH